ncbi:uncharacterized protein LOC143294091 [Babylonia areolata]|uniref:uncharacterized protein LOC143294091 n=1 Tax=Babylonia areolata TaxID=304850 RepID=UPI003FD159EF
MKRAHRVFLYFSSWVLLALGCVVLNVINIDWTRTNIVQGIIIVLILGVLQGSVMEFPVQTIATLLVGGDRRANATAPADHLTVVLNYNILATSEDDIDECLQTMYEAYMGNLDENVSAVLVSATNDERLKEYELQVRDNYRALIYDTLFREGLNFASGDLRGVDPARHERVWRRYEHVDGDLFARDYLDGVCDEFAREFMVVHRVSRVLRKCGQYQDLMLLSAGHTTAYTYTDPAYYGRQARPMGELLFQPSADVDNIWDRGFDYTLVLDGDTGVVKGSVFQLLAVAAAHPERGIVQPAIKLHCAHTDTLFMHMEVMRQEIYEPLTNAMTALLGQSSYFGKALIRNDVYIRHVIGTRDNLIERVPVDVLSHDTFEAALLRPLYCGSVFLLEAPSYNYITWNIRERRWNRGEVLLSMYFWKNALGRPMRWVQRKLQGSRFNPTRLRTEAKLDIVTSYVAHSALRQMMMKPLLLVYIIIHYRTSLLYTWASIIVVMFLVLVFPKFATCNRRNYRYVLLETLASFLQFTPEALVGCVRIVRAVQANLVLNAKWVPQRAVEEQFKRSNPFLSSFRHLWGYSAFAGVSGVLVAVFAMDAVLIFVMLGTLFLLPFYTGLTSLNPRLQSSRALARRREALETGAIATITKPDKSAASTAADTSSLLIPSAFTNSAFSADEDAESQSQKSYRIPRPALFPPALDVAGSAPRLLSPSFRAPPTSEHCPGLSSADPGAPVILRVSGLPATAPPQPQQQQPQLRDCQPVNVPLHVTPQQLTVPTPTPPPTCDLSRQSSPCLPRAYSSRTFLVSEEAYSPHRAGSNSMEA